MSGRGGGEDRRLDFKFQGLTNDELRRRREETTIELRRSKREDSLNKRRNIFDHIDSPSPLPQEQLAVPSSPRPSGITLGRSFEEWVLALNSNDCNLIADACLQFRKVLSKERNPPIEDVIRLGIVPRFVGLLNSSQIPLGTPHDVVDKIVFESAWVLTNIASGASHQTMEVVNAEAVPVFIHLLSSTNSDIREQSVWALGNIAGDSPQLRDYVLQNNITMNLLQVIYDEANSPSPSLPLLRNAVWALSNLCRGKPMPSWNQVVVALPVLTHLLSSNDDEILTDACWALSYLTDGANEHLSDIISSGAVSKLVELLSMNVQTPALRAIGNVVTGDDNQTQFVVNLGVLKHLRMLLNSSKSSIQKEACWAISNITAGTVQQIQTVVDENIFPILIGLLSRADYRTKREACWAICNATSCFDTAPNIIRYLVGQNCIGPLCEILKHPDSKTLQVALDGLENILCVGENDAVNSENGINSFALAVEECGGMDSIWGLQSHEDTHVYIKAKGIIDKFFSEESEDVNIQVSGTSNTFSF